MKSPLGRSSKYANRWKSTQVLTKEQLAERRPETGFRAEPLIIKPFCPDKPILAGFLDNFALCLFSALAGHHDDRDLISLTRRVVNCQQERTFVRFFGQIGI
jgi:hypothetical protein